ncbi:MAG: hypothetical protein AAF799_11020 [Myxococcota bacterium]
MVLLGGSVVGTACAAKPGSGSAEGEAAASSVSDRARTKEPVSYLVWNQWPKRDGGFNYETIWVTEDELGQGELGEVDALVFAAGDQVLTWEAEPVEFESGDCEGGTRRLSDWSGRLVPPGGGSTVAVYEPIRGRSEQDYGQFQRSLLVTGNIGPYLFTRQSLEHQPCDEDRPSVSREARVFDLRTGAAVDMQPKPASKVLDEIVGVAGRSIRTKPALAPYAPDSPGDIHIIELVPDFGPEGMEVELLVGVETCHACSKSEAGSGTWSMRLPHDVPPLLRNHLDVPDMVGDRFKAFGRDWQFGFTTVTSDKADAKLREVFSNPSGEPRSIRRGGMVLDRRADAKRAEPKRSADTKMAEPR